MALFSLAVTGSCFAWEQFHNDQAKTGFTGADAPGTGNLLWESSDIGAVDASSAVVAEGKVFVNGNTLLSALNLSDGSLIWSVPVAGDTMSYGSWSSPAYHDGKVFLPNDGARWAANGSLIWSGLPWTCDGSPTVADGKVFQGDWDGHFNNPDGALGGHYFAYDEQTGQQLWKMDVDGYSQGTPAYANDCVYLTSWSYGSEYQGHVYCANADTGSVVWQTDLAMSACGSAAVANGIVYVTTYNFDGNGELYALYESNGTVLWSRTIERTDSTPAIAYGNVYVCGGCVGYSEGQKTYCFDAMTGTPVWETDYTVEAGDWTSSIAVADDKIFVGRPGSAGGMDFSYNGVYCLDACNGSTIWYNENGGGSPAIADGILLVVDNHKVYAYRDPAPATPLPAAEFSADVTSGTTPLTVHFTDMSTDALEWQWDFDSDGIVDSTEQNPVHTYSLSRQYTVTLTVANAAGSDTEVKADHVTSVLAPAPSAVPGWTTFQNDTYNTGSTSEKGPATAPVCAWNYKVNSGGMAGIDVSPIVADGTVYTIDHRGVVWAIGEDDGTLLWKNDRLCNASGMGFELCTPLYQNGVLYVAIIKNGTGIYALNATDGSLIWVNKAIFPQTGAAAQPNTPIKSDGQRLYVGSWGSGASVQDGYYCLDCSDGSLVWQILGGGAGWSGGLTGGYYWAGASIIGDYVVFGSDNASIMSVNKYSGQIVDIRNVSATFGVNAREIRSSMAYDPVAGKLFFTSKNSASKGQCYAIGFDNATGMFDADDRWVANIDYSTSTPAVYGGRVYVGSGSFTPGGKVYCLDESTGAEIWAFGGTNGGVQASPAVSSYYDNGDGEVYIYFTTNAASGSVYCLNKDGQQVWMYTPPTGKTQYALQGVALSGGRAFFGNDAGYLFALEDSQPPAAGFSADVVLGSSPLTVNFTDLSSGTTAWAWDFDSDGTTDSTEQSPAYTYHMPGTYSVKLTASNVAGSDEEVKEGYIVVKDQVLYDGTVSLENGGTFEFIASNSETMHSVSQTTDMGALDASPLSYEAGDAYFAAFGSYSIESIDGIMNEDWTLPGYRYWYIVVNGVPASMGLSQNNVADGDIVEYYYTTCDPLTYQPDLVNYTFKARMTVDISTLDPADWYRFQHDRYNSGITAEAGPVANDGSAAFATFTKAGGMSGIDVPPVVVGDTAYVVAQGEAFAVNKSTGEIIWNRTVGTGFTLATPAVADGKMFVGTSNSKIAALNASTGALLWINETMLDYGQVNTPIVYDEGLIYFGTWGGLADGYYCLDEATGDMVWKYSYTVYDAAHDRYENAMFYWAGAAVIGDYLVFGDDEANLTSMYKSNGTPVQKLYVPSTFGVDSQEIRSTVTYSPENSRVYFTSKGGYCYYLGFDNATGTFNEAAKAVGTIDYTTSTPAVYNGRVYVGTGSFSPDGGLRCLDADTLVPIWTYVAGGGVQSSPALSTYYDDGDGEVYIYFTTNVMNGGLHCLKDYTGNTAPVVQFVYTPESARQQYTLQGAAISDGMLYYGNDKGYLFALKDPLPAQVPVADFTANVTSGMVPLSVQFTDQSMNDPAAWAWDFDDDGTIDSTLQNPLYTYNAPGTYTVNLTATNAAGSDSEVKTSYVTVDGRPPQVSFTRNLSGGYAPLTVQFNDTSRYCPTSWKWDFDWDDVVDSTEQNPAWTYSTPGLYSVKLEVENDYGSSMVVNMDIIDVTTPTATPTPSLAPVADFTADVVNGCMPLTVQFSDMSTDATSYEWDFDSDGTTDSTEQNPVYAYSAAGVYTVTLKAANSAGSDTEIKTGYITVYPIPGVAVSPSTLYLASLGGMQTFDIVADQLPYGLAGYTLNVSLDHPQTGEIVSVTYPDWATLNSTMSEPGDNVRISALDLNNTIQAGATGVVLATVTISSNAIGTTNIVLSNVDMDYDGGAPVTPTTGNGHLIVFEGLVADFSATPVEGARPLAVQFTDLSTGNPGATSWLWAFDDGSTSTERNPLHTYTVPGTYTVSLTVSNEYGPSTATKSGFITVLPLVEPFPGQTAPPTDVNGDGLYEDLNGNGRLDFDDIVVLFQNLEWAQNNTNVGPTPYDYNHNGRIDYDDIVTLYQMKLG